jgi:phospholipid/cholesterol/gamma-HCH transport system permease protein
MARTEGSEPRVERFGAENTARLQAFGAWTAAHAGLLEQIIVETSGSPVATLDLTGLERLDTFGGWAIEKIVRNAGASVVGVAANNRGLVGALERIGHVPERIAKRLTIFDRLAEIGSSVEGFGRGLLDLCALFGRLALTFLAACRHPVRFRFRSIVHHIDRVGVAAVPIIVMMTFLIGCIIAQQGFFNFRRFAAEDYVVDLVSVLVLREIAVLLVTIMVAGRSGSAYTAELGAMKMREEIDALTTMGFDSAEFLILPRVLALVVVAPMLTFIGDLAALYGAGIVAWLYGDMSPPIYIARLGDAISLEHFEVGMIKAPFMALIVGLVACSEGLKVKGSTETLGLRTTSSVVQSIFLVIVLDGLFAIFFAAIGL